MSAATLPAPVATGPHTFTAEVYGWDFDLMASHHYYIPEWHWETVWAYAVRPLIKICYPGTHCLPADFDLEASLEPYRQDLAIYGDLLGRRMVALTFTAPADQWKRFLALSLRLDTTPEALIRVAFGTRSREWHNDLKPLTAPTP